MATNTRISAGLATCRYNKDKRKWEMILVQRRVSYKFIDFVHFHYNPSDLQELLSLFNGMTLDEKLLIHSLDFAKIWYKIWLDTATKPKFFLKKKQKFEQTWLVPDNGATLRKLLSGTINTPLSWEIPKGRPNGKERFLLAAEREFGEETGVGRRFYKLVPDFQRVKKYRVRNIQYTNIYFAALTKMNFQLSVRLSLESQTAEVNDVRWMTLDELKILDPNSRLIEDVDIILRYMKKHYRGLTI